MPPHVYGYIYICMCNPNGIGAAVISMCNAMHSLVTLSAKPELPPPSGYGSRERKGYPLPVLTPLDHPSHQGVNSLANLPRDKLWQRQRQH